MTTSSIGMTAPVAYWGALPHWAWHVIPDPRVYRFYGWLHSKIDNKSRTCWQRQTKMAEEYGVSVSTISRWMSELKRVGAVVARYRWAGDTERRLSDLLYLPAEDPRLPACMSSVGVDSTEVTTPTTSLTTFERVTSGSLRSPDVAELGKDNGNEDEVPVRAVSADQMSLFGDESVFDSLGSSCDAGSSKVKKKVVVERSGSPVHRVTQYWLEGRVSVPHRGVVAGVGKAVKQCLDSGVSEEELKRAFDALMMVGFDTSSTQLLAKFGLYRRPKAWKPRDYEKDPLFHRQPRRSTMNRDRKTAITLPPSGPGWTMPSLAGTSMPSSRPSSTSAAPSTTTEIPGIPTVHRDVRTASKKRYSYDYEEYDAGTMVRRQRMGRSIGDVLKSIGFGRDDN